MISLPVNQPVSMQADQPVCLPASQPPSQYASWSASLPASQPASQYASWSASLPASQPASQYASWSARDVPVIGKLQSHLDESVRAEATVLDELLAKVLKWVNRDLQILHQPGKHRSAQGVYFYTELLRIVVLSWGGGGCCVLYWYRCLW